MIVLIYLGITLITYGLMELITWFTHKYIMHGFLWVLHEDHHQPNYKHAFEMNDAFFLIGAVPSVILFYYGVNPEFNYKFFIAVGILFYGMSYFLVHDVLIHRRFKWFNTTNNRYLKGLRKAHKVHHKHLGKEEGECFGMLNVPKRYFKKPTS
jgi:beta-carotene 3-hydroxylase